MKVRNYDQYAFCEHWYFSSMYRRSYSEVMHATRDMKQWEHTCDVRFFHREPVKARISKQEQDPYRSLWSLEKGFNVFKLQRERA